MSDDPSKRKDAVVRNTESGTTSERDFGKTDRYANKDDGENVDFRATGDGSEWDKGREASIAHGTNVEDDLRAADAETPGVKTRPAMPPQEKEEP